VSYDPRPVGKPSVDSLVCKRPARLIWNQSSLPAPISRGHLLGAELDVIVTPHPFPDSSVGSVVAQVPIGSGKTSSPAVIHTLVFAVARYHKLDAPSTAEEPTFPLPAGSDFFDIGANIETNNELGFLSLCVEVPISVLNLSAYWIAVLKVYSGCRQHQEPRHAVTVTRPSVCTLETPPTKV